MFWSLPKRPPSKIIFDPSNELHATFICAFACLTAKKYNIEIQSEANPFDSKNPRSKESKLKMAE
jgi:hypothetical protein